MLSYGWFKNYDARHWAKVLCLFYIDSIDSIDSEHFCVSLSVWRAGALVQWLKLPSWKGDRGFESRSGIQVSKKHNVSPPLTRKDSTLWRTSVAES